MKKITFTISFLFLALFSYSQCNYTLEMNDSYGDGWGTGNSIDLSVGGVTTNYTLSGPWGSTFSTSVEFEVTTGDDITTVFNCGSTYCGEASFRILDSSGNELVSNAGAGSGSMDAGPADVTTGTITANCPSCPSPTSLSATNVSAMTADISWISNETSFNIEVVNVTLGGSATGVATYSGVSSPYSLTGLSSNSDYEVYVQADCISDQSPWASLSFTTSPGCGDTVTHCYEGGTYSIFDATVDNSGDYITATILTGDTESCCDTLIVYDSSDNSGNILYSERGDHSGQVITSTTGTISVWVDADGSWDCDDGAGGPYDPISVELSCTPPPSCIAPSALTASNVSTTSADLSWTAGGSETDYEYVVQAAGTGEPTAAGTAVNGATTVSVGLLSANTAYEVYVRSACTGEFSDWSDVLNFTTSTDPLVVGAGCFDFEMGGLGSSVGLTENTQSSASLMASAGNASSNGIVLTGGSSGTNWTGYSTSTTETNAWVDNVLHQSAVVMEVDATAESTVVLTFDLKQTYSYGYTYSNFRVTVNDTQIGNTLYPSTASSDSFVNQNYDLSAYAGTSFTLKLEFSGKYSNEYAASVGYAGDTAYVDNICVTAPSCLAPTGITVSQITDCCADLSWTAGGSETDYEYVVQAAGTGEPTGAGTAVTGATTVSVGPYASNTEFEVYVRSNCGVDGFSSWAGPVNFTTEPEPIVPNYTNDFTTFPGDLWTLDQGFTSAWTSDGFANNGTTGAAKSNIYSSGNNNKMYSPIFDLSAGPYYLNLKAAVTAWNSSTSGSAMGSDDSVTVSISTDGGTTWTALYVWDLNNTPPIEGVDMPEVDLSSYSSNSARFAIIMDDGAVNDLEDYDFFVDDFQITTTSLGVDDNQISLFNYFPNPVKDVLTIKAQNNVEDVKVFNMLGQMVLRQNPYSRDCIVDLSTMQTGAYFVQVSIGNTVETVRILKN